MILCMPERVSGGDAKFQGFCDGWNKWKGQVLAGKIGHIGDALVDHATETAAFVVIGSIA